VQIFIHCMCIYMSTREFKYQYCYLQKYNIYYIVGLSCSEKIDKIESHSGSLVERSIIF
jgi:hypothetical protein